MENEKKGEREKEIKGNGDVRNIRRWLQRRIKYAKERNEGVIYKKQNRRKDEEVDGNMKNFLVSWMFSTG